MSGVAALSDTRSIDRNSGVAIADRSAFARLTFDVGRRCAFPTYVLQQALRVAGILSLMRDRVDSRANVRFTINDGIREAAKRINAQPIADAHAELLVPVQQCGNSFKLVEECACDAETCVRFVVDRRLGEFAFSSGMNPVAHEIRARARATASAPAVRLVSPDKTSASRRSASATQAS